MDLGKPVRSRRAPGLTTMSRGRTDTCPFGRRMIIGNGGIPRSLCEGGRMIRKRSRPHEIVVTARPGDRERGTFSTPLPLPDHRPTLDPKLRPPERHPEGRLKLRHPMTNPPRHPPSPRSGEGGRGRGAGKKEIHRVSSAYKKSRKRTQPEPNPKTRIEPKPTERFRMQRFRSDDQDLTKNSENEPNGGEGRKNRRSNPNRQVGD